MPLLSASPSDIFCSRTETESALPCKEVSAIDVVVALKVGQGMLHLDGTNVDYAVFFAVEAGSPPVKLRHGPHACHGGEIAGIERRAALQ